MRKILWVIGLPLRLLMALTIVVFGALVFSSHLDDIMEDAVLIIKGRL